MSGVELRELIGRYWELAYAEGKEGRDHDTEDGAAAACWHEIRERIAAMEADGARLDWLAANVLGVPWTHPSGQGCRVTFDVAKDCRVTVYEPRQPTADELRAALDAANTKKEST